MEIRVIGCNDNGLALDDGSLISWEHIDVIRKSEWLRHSSSRSKYYLRKKGNRRNIELSLLDPQSHIGGRDNEDRMRHLKLNVLEHGKQVPHVRFLYKVMPFGKEWPWDIEKEVKRMRYYDSPAAKQASAKLRKQLPIALFWICVAVVSLYLVLGLVFTRL